MDAIIRLVGQDLTKAAFASVGKNITKLGDEAASLPKKLALIGSGLAGLTSAAAFASMITSSIEARARLKDLSLQTNITVEGLTALGKVGKYSGTSLDDIASASARLSKALFSQDEDAKGAAEGVRALGLNFKQFQSLSPEQQMLAIANAMEEFRDDAGKTAVAMLLFGKQGATLLPFLKELAERGLATVSKETAEAAARAKEYEDNLVTLKSAGEQWKKELVDGILPGLVSVTRELVEGRKAYGGYLAAILDLGTENPMRSLGENIQATNEKLDEAKKKVAETQAAGKDGIYIGGKRKSLKAMEEEVALLEKRQKYYKAIQTLEALDKGTGVQDDPRIAIRKPGLQPRDATAQDMTAQLKKELDGQIKLIEQNAEQRKDALEFENRLAKGAYDQSLVSLREYHEAEAILRNDALRSQLKRFDEEVAARRAYLAKYGKTLKGEAIQEENNKIREATENRSRAVQKAAQEDILAAQQEAAAVKQLADQYEDFQAQMKELEGDRAGAAAIRNARQVRQAVELLTRSGVDPEQIRRQTQALGERLASMSALSRVQEDYSRLVEASRAAEELATLRAQEAGTDELTLLREIGTLRQGAIGDLRQLADEAARLARELATPEARQAALQLQVQLARAGAEISPIYQRMRDIGQEAAADIASGLGEAVARTRSWSEALKSVEQQLIAIGTRVLVTKPLEGYLTNLLGGNGQASGGGGLIGSLLGSLGLGGTTGGAPAGPTTGDFARMDRLNFAGGFADGGFIPPGQWGWTGEEGAERVYGGRTGVTVVPQGGGGTTHIHYHAAPGESRATMLQRAGDLRRIVQGGGRNG